MKQLLGHPNASVNLSIQFLAVITILTNFKSGACPLAFHWWKASQIIFLGLPLSAGSDSTSGVVIPRIAQLSRLTLVVKKMNRKKQKWQIGDIFLVQLKDGSFSVGQVLAITKEALYSVICAFSNIRINNDK